MQIQLDTKQAFLSDLFVFKLVASSIGKGKGDQIGLGVVIFLDRVHDEGLPVGCPRNNVRD